MIKKQISLRRELNRGLTSAALLAAALLTGAVAASAQTTYVWTGTSGNNLFFSEFDWDLELGHPGIEPTDIAIINNGGTANFLGFSSGTSATFAQLDLSHGTLNISSTSPGSPASATIGTLNLTALTPATQIGTLDIGNNATVSVASPFLLGGGNLRLNGGTLNIGAFHQTSGTISIASGSILSTGTNEATGRQRLASTTAASVVDLDMTGGTWSIEERFLIGSSATAATPGATYVANLSGNAQLSAANYLVIGAGNSNNGQATRITLNDSARLLKGATNKLIIGDGDGGDGTLTLNKSSAIDSQGEVDVGWSGGTGKLFLNGASSLVSAKQLSIGRNGGTGTLEMSGTSTLTLATSGLNIGYVGAASQGTLIMKENSSATVGGYVEIGREQANAGGVGNDWGGTLDMRGKATLTLANQNMVVSSSDGSARLLMADDTAITGIAQLNFLHGSARALVQLSGNAQLNADNARIRGKNTLIELSDSARITFANGVNFDGGEGTNVAIALNDNSLFQVNGTGAYALSKGNNRTALELNGSAGFEMTAATSRLVLADGNNSTTTVTLNDSSRLVAAGMIVVGHYSNDGTSSATLTIGNGAGSAFLQTQTLVLGRYDDAANSPSSTVNLNAGGTLAVHEIRKGGGTGAKTLNADGGVIRALSGREEFFTAGYEKNGFNALEGHVAVNLNTGGLTFDTQEFDVATAAVFNGTGTLTKTGTGTLRLNGSHLDGATLVTAGTLGGTGTLGDITVQNGATLAPGNSVGTLTAGNVVLEAGATLLVEYANGTGDVLAADSVTFAAGSILFITVADGTGLVTGGVVDFFNGQNVNLTGVDIQSSGGYQFAYVGGALTVTAIPEPSTYALLAGGVALGLAALRRRARRS